MKIIAIGLGSAGCRIVDTLVLHDTRSGAARCVEAIAVDRDASTLTALRHIPDNLKIFFRPLDPDNKTEFTRSITSDEIVSKLLTLDRGEVDAVIIASGLGGGMVDLVPALIREIRLAMQEHVFALATLPWSGEGREVLAKAASDVEMLHQVLDGVILFDNNVWCRKVPGCPQADRGILAGPRDKKGKQAQEIPWKGINDLISRRFGLLLRAGELAEDGSQESAEVVLDAGEVLRTISGMGLIALGYAAEKVPERPGGLARIFKGSAEDAVARQKKAERIVELAKRAINEEISIRCDLASAKKALVLIAGPSHELSMKGFMAVRKWIDRAISGPEMRSGDYPVSNTQYVAIIVVLSGLVAVPRIDELREVRKEVMNTRPVSQPQVTAPWEPQVPIQEIPVPERKKITLGAVSARMDGKAFRETLEKDADAVPGDGGLPQEDSPPARERDTY